MLSSFLSEFESTLPRRTLDLLDNSKALRIEMNAQPEVMTEYTRDELRYLVYRHTGRSLSISQFYRWLPVCLIERKSLYTSRDAKKLMFIASQLNRVRGFEFAKQQLLRDLETNPHKYEDTINV